MCLHSVLCVCVLAYSSFAVWKLKCVLLLMRKFFRTLIHQGAIFIHVKARLVYTQGLK